MKEKIEANWQKILDILIKNRMSLRLLCIHGLNLLSFSPSQIQPSLFMCPAVQEALNLIKHK